MEIEFIDTKKPKLTWDELQNGEWFVFDEPALYEIHGLCRKHFETLHLISYQDQRGHSYHNKTDALITRVRIHKIVCQKVVEQ